MSGDRDTARRQHDGHRHRPAAHHFKAQQFEVSGSTGPGQLDKTRDETSLRRVPESRRRLFDLIASGAVLSIDQCKMAPDGHLLDDVDAHVRRV
jgi:hypothetical protein